MHFKWNYWNVIHIIKNKPIDTMTILTEKVKMPMSKVEITFVIDKHYYNKTTISITIIQFLWLLHTFESKNPRAYNNITKWDFSFLTMICKLSASILQ